MNILAVKCCGKYFDSAALASELIEYLKAKYGIELNPIVAELLSISAVLGDPNKAVYVLWSKHDLLREVEQKEVCEELMRLNLPNIRCSLNGDMILQVSADLLEEIHQFLCNLVRELMHGWADAEDVLALATYLSNKSRETVELTCN